MIGDGERLNGNGVGSEFGIEKGYEIPHLNAPPGILSYRAFCLDAGGGISASITVEAQSDAEAIGIVDVWSNANGIDLWERGRLIASFPPRPEDGRVANNRSTPVPALVPDD